MASALRMDRGLSWGDGEKEKEKEGTKEESPRHIASPRASDEKSQEQRRFLPPPTHPSIAGAPKISAPPLPKRSQSRVPSTTVPVEQTPEPDDDTSGEVQSPPPSYNAPNHDTADHKSSAQDDVPEDADAPTQDAFHTPTEETTLDALIPPRAVSPASTPLPSSPPSTPGFSPPVSPRPDDPAPRVPESRTAAPALGSSSPAPPPLPRRAGARAQPPPTPTLPPRARPVPAPPAPLVEPAEPARATPPSREDENGARDETRASPEPTAGSSAEAEGAAEAGADEGARAMVSVSPTPSPSAPGSDVESAAEVESPVDDVPARPRVNGVHAAPGAGPDGAVYIGDATWEERTWKELVRLREDMFWARVGGVR